MLQARSETAPSNLSAASNQPAADAAALGTYSALTSAGRNQQNVSASRQEAKARGQVRGRSGCSYKQHRALGRAVRWYQARVRFWTHRMGDRERVALRAMSPCPRNLAHVLQRKARAARLAYERWYAYQYDWATWLPDRWQRIGACETGYGRRPGNWRHSNSSYEGAFGFAKSSWDAFKYRADPKAGPYPEDAWQASPRQQYEVALAIWRAYGYSGWGCRNA